ncbi:uncharacterized protein Dmul_13580 [Desulfococcus multivorans]|nr:uncharacterized protein Dmul_13580 [Desulfococcus multivorans]
MNSGRLVPLSPDRPSVHRPSMMGFLALFAGLLARAYLYWMDPLISSDGFLYVQQARALYFRDFDQLLSCYDNVSCYPVFVAAAFSLFGEWVIAGQMTSLFFGTLSLLPLYWILRRFFVEPTASITLLIFALLPVFVWLSRDVLRDPTYWCFSLFGLYFFLRHIEHRRPMGLFISSICFLMGAWARIEGCLFILASACYLIFSCRPEKWRDLFIFFSPYIVAAAAGILYSQVAGIETMDVLKPERLLTRPGEFLSKYREIRDHLTALVRENPTPISPYFFDWVRHLVWFLPFAILMVQITETLFYLFFIILISGIVVWRHEILRDRRLIFLAALSIAALMVLYMQIVYNWSMTDRFIALFLFPAFVFLGAGVSCSASALSTYFKLTPKKAHILMCVIVLAVFVPKILRANYDTEKLIFSEIGEFIAQKEKNQRVVSVAGNFKELRAVHFYANRNYPGAPCFEDGISILKQSDRASLVFVLSHGFDYFVWNEKAWQNGYPETLLPERQGQFQKLRQWSSAREGDLILYEVRQ